MGTLRIVAGIWRGRRLVTPAGRATRPTADKTRQALFDILGDVEGAAVADLFAGSGALGLEALSRGAARLVLVEQAHPALEAVRTNLKRLGPAVEVRIIRRDLRRGFGFLGPEGPFDLILADPPYDRGWVERLLAGLGPELFTPRGRLVVESSLAEAPQAGAGWALIDQRRYGRGAISILNPEAL